MLVYGFWLFVSAGYSGRSAVDGASVGLSLVETRGRFMAGEEARMHQIGKRTKFGVGLALLPAQF